jgi:hypothetical protein
MRALGPGSISSLLKMGLDVFWYVLMVTTAAFVLGAVVTPISPVIPEATIPSHDAAGAAIQVPLTRLMLTKKLVDIALYSGVLLFIVRGLRRIFLTLIAGDPFRPENVRRLRGVGVGLGALAALYSLVPATDQWLWPGLFPTSRLAVDLTPWFSVVVVFVLAEVFREGARLRREAELTI